LNTGSASISWLEGFQALLISSENNLTQKIIMEERLFRALNALMAGGSLGLVGLVLQSYFRNPLAGPGVLGISSGASLGVAVAILIPVAAIWGSFSQYLFGLIGSFTVIAALIFINKWIRGVSLLVVGLMISFFTSAFVSALLNESSDGRMRKYIEWGFGSFGAANHDFFWLYTSAIIGLLLISFVLLPKILNIWVLRYYVPFLPPYTTRQVYGLHAMPLVVRVAPGRVAGCAPGDGA
jgi:iron complex transport system permease protein